MLVIAIVLLLFVFGAASILIAFGVLGLSGVTGVLVAVACFALIWAVYVLLVRSLQAWRTRQRIRYIASAVDNEDRPLMIAENTKVLHAMMAGVRPLAERFADVSGMSDVELLQGVGAARALGRFTAEYQICYASRDEKAAHLGTISHSLAEEVTDLYEGQLRERGWPESRIRRRSRAAARRAALAARLTR